jgi:hypothetical protein
MFVPFALYALVYDDRMRYSCTVTVNVASMVSGRGIQGRTSCNSMRIGFDAVALKPLRTEKREERDRIYVSTDRICTTTYPRVAPCRVRLLTMCRLLPIRRVASHPGSVSDACSDNPGTPTHPVRCHPSTSTCIRWSGCC